ncbi:hypothetical protein J6590_048790 [Homalodisca vitripennis]|nr:hypothetical protein J6590_048790 [Homalodisca vitripennis]
MNRRPGRYAPPTSIPYFWRPRLLPVTYHLMSPGLLLAVSNSRSWPADSPEDGGNLHHSCNGPLMYPRDLCPAILMECCTGHFGHWPLPIPEQFQC